MKKTYLSPETDLLLIATQNLMAVSGFDENLDNDDTITPDRMLSRRRQSTVWDDEELEEEEDF